MANPKCDTVEFIVGLGGKTISPPQRLHKHHAKAGVTFSDDESLLVAVLVTPHGDYLKEISLPSALEQVRASPYAKTFVEIPKAVFDQLRSHPRAKEVLR